MRVQVPVRVQMRVKVRVRVPGQAWVRQRSDGSHVVTHTRAHTLTRTRTHTLISAVHQWNWSPCATAGCTRRRGALQWPLSAAEHDRRGEQLRYP